MKSIYYTVLLTIGLGSVANSQILSNSVPAPAIAQSNAFLDASTNYGNINSGNNNKHKGLIFPDVDLRTFEFESTIADGATIPGYYDGMVVYNIGLGLTGNSPATQGVQVNVAPGFYYFSNPSGNADGGVISGRWIPIGSPANNVVKTREVIKTINPGANTAIVNLNDGDAGAGSGMSAVTVNEFIGAKVYVNNVAKDLQMSATSGYNKVSNELTTGNGFMYQVLAPGTYRFVIEYK